MTTPAWWCSTTQLYMLGGEGHADVWRSTDGKDWTQLTAEADWGPRNGYAPMWSSTASCGCSAAGHGKSTNA